VGVPKIEVGFRFLTGIRRPVFETVLLTGNWDEDGHPHQDWIEIPMTATRGEDGCPAFVATVGFDPGMVGKTFHWGVRLDGPQGEKQWGIPTEVPDPESRDRHRNFVLQRSGGTKMQIESYHLTHCRRLGAQKIFPEGSSAPGIRFSVWAPHAWKVEVVFGREALGYIADDGTGLDNSLGPYELKKGADQVWSTDLERYPDLQDFGRFRDKPYMFRITLRSGKEVYRTDLFSRSQFGQGDVNPRGKAYSGPRAELDGTVSCSTVCDLDSVAGLSGGLCSPEFGRFPVREFWKQELRNQRPRVRQVGDLVIYELHVGALGFGHQRPGSFADAIDFLDQLSDLGINAVELLPIAEFSGWASWGYGPSHLFAPESSAGGRHHLKHFIRECHRRGILVILDVVYNHYTHEGLRAQWQYDSEVPEENAYYWYQGHADEYPHCEGGYLDNGSSGWSPAFHEEMVRKYLISSAVEFLEEYQVDGFRVDLLDAIHRNHVLHQSGKAVPAANAAGARFLREWTRTLRLLRPEVLLIAEDHSGWDGVFSSPGEGGFGFDACWQASFNHHLIGDAQPDPHYARLLENLAWDDEGPMPMRRFAEALQATEPRRIVYHESHDEAGNSSYVVDGQRRFSQRTIQVAAAGKNPQGPMHFRAQGLSRLAFGLTMLSAGTPMFLMGEEVAAQEEYHYDDFLWKREDLVKKREGVAAPLFRFYQDLIRLRLGSNAIRTGGLKILLADDKQRLLVFARKSGFEELLVIVNCNARAFLRGYKIHGLDLRDSNWRECFNSDSQFYGGDGVGNATRPILCEGNTMDLVLPMHGFLVLR
jgi:1,4-alpha-glucan branching enzyme